MSTPVSISTPPHSKKTVRRSNETDHQQLVEHMQRMIDLQYQQQRMQEAEAQTGESLVPENHQVFKESLSQTNSGQSASSPNVLSGLYSEEDDSFVGKGTLLWRTSSERLLASYRLGSFLSNNSTGTSVDEQDGDVHARLLPTLNKSSAPSHAALQLSSTYGSFPDATQISHSNLDVLFQPPPPQPLTQHPQLDFGAASFPATTTPYPPPPPPPYEGASGAERDLPPDAYTRRRDAFESNRRGQYWRCVYRCILSPIQHCCYSWFMAESLHRSFCYGAIDGMLTGAGIVSTFCGMRLLASTNHNSRSLVVAFTAAACFADAVCMAIGHVWTTRVLAEARANERLQARYQLLHTKADAKGVLVDLLLARGMLKIDAMSLADTLEGYPDLFVNVLTGDALSAGIAAVPARHPPMPLPDQTGGGEEDDDLLDSPRHRPSPVAYHSYGRLTEYEMDPDQYTVQSLGAESRRESLCMLLGFSLFSVVPSLFYALVPALLLGSHAAASSSNETTTPTAPTINPNTLILFLTAGVMWCLGIWKSRFLDSNWVLYGMETVGVLLVCMACAYSLGALLNHIFLPDDYVLQVVTHTDHIRPDDSSAEEMTPSAAHHIHPHQWYLF